MRRSSSVVLVAAFVVASGPAQGSPDPGFGVGGLVTTDLGTRSDAAFDTLVQPDGKVVVVGKHAAGTAVCRYLATGALDTTFGAGGVVLGPALGTAVAVVRQSTGALVVGGGTAGVFWVLTRYGSNGALDKTFGSAGTGMTSLPRPGPALRVSSVLRGPSTTTSAFGSGFDRSRPPAGPDRFRVPHPIA